MLFFTATYCSTPHHTATQTEIYCTTLYPLHHTVTHLINCSTSHHTALHNTALQRTDVDFTTLQHTALHCSTPHNTVTPRTTLHHTAQNALLHNTTLHCSKMQQNADTAPHCTSLIVGLFVFSLCSLSYWFSMSVFFMMEACFGRQTWCPCVCSSCPCLYVVVRHL